MVEGMAKVVVVVVVDVVEVVVVVDVVLVVVDALVVVGCVLATSMVVAGADEFAVVVASDPQAPATTAVARTNTASGMGRCTV